MPTKPEPKIEIKSVKHTFTPVEREDLGSGLARCIGTCRGIETEFDQVKASFKAKLTEAEARIDNLSTSLVNGFEMRNERCAVVYRPSDRKKDYFLEAAFNVSGQKGLLEPVLTEDMTRDDFQAELIQAESKFDCREEIELFNPTDSDSGVLVVGRFGQKWFSALRVKIGKLVLDERLDSEQKAFNFRPDAVAMGVKRISEWSKANLKDLAKGFEESFRGVAEAHKERQE